MEDSTIKEPASPAPPPSPPRAAAAPMDQSQEDDEEEERGSNPQQEDAAILGGEVAGDAGGGGGGWSESDDDDEDGGKGGGMAVYERRMEAMVQEMMQRADDELYDEYGSDQSDAEEAHPGAAAKDEEEIMDEEARFWLQYQAQQRAAAAEVARQKRAFRREWSSANKLCYLRVVGRRIPKPSPAPTAGTAASTVDAGGGAGRAVAATLGPGWEWHPPPGVDEGGEETSGGSYVEGVAAVAGRKARLWPREEEGEEEEVFLRHGREGGTELLAIDRRPTSPSELPDPRLLALIRGRERRLKKDGCGGMDAADPAVVIAEELAGELAARVLADLEERLLSQRHEGREGVGMRSRESSKRLMDEGVFEEVGEVVSGGGAGQMGAMEAGGIEPDEEAARSQTKYPRK